VVSVIPTDSKTPLGTDVGCSFELLLLGEEGALELLGLHDGINESDSVGDSLGLRLGDAEGALLGLLLKEMLGAGLSDPEVGGGGIIGNKRLGTGIACSLQLSLGEDAEGVPKERLLGLEEGMPDGRFLDSMKASRWVTLMVVPRVIGLDLHLALLRDTLGLEDGTSISVFGVGSGTVPGVGLGMLP
jgi:hypothetical protein